MTDGSILLGLTFEADGTFWAVRSNGDAIAQEEIIHYNADGTPISSETVLPPLTSAYTLPNDIAFGPDGNIYVSTWNDYCVVRYNIVDDTWEEYLPAAPGAHGKTLAFICGLVDCPMTCTLSITDLKLNPCDPATNEYSLEVTVNYSNEPSGNITVTVDGTDYTFTPSGTGTDMFLVTGLPADGTPNIDVSAVFVNDNTCTDTIVDAYNAPADCSTCNVTITPCPQEFIIDNFDGDCSMLINDPPIVSDSLECITPGAICGSRGMYATKEEASVSGGQLLATSDISGQLVIGEDALVRGSYYITYDGPSGNGSKNPETNTGLGGLDFSGSNFGLDLVAIDINDQPGDTRTMTVTLKVWSGPNNQSQSDYTIDNNTPDGQRLFFPNSRPYPVVELIFQV